MVEDPITDARPEVIGIIVKATTNGGCRGEYIFCNLTKLCKSKLKVEFVGHEGLFKSLHLCVSYKRTMRTKSTDSACANSKMKIENFLYKFPTIDS